MSQVEVAVRVLLVDQKCMLQVAVLVCSVGQEGESQCVVAVIAVLVHLRGCVCVQECAVIVHQKGWVCGLECVAVSACLVGQAGKGWHVGAVVVRRRGVAAGDAVGVVVLLVLPI